MADIEFSIRAVDEDGNGIKGVEVHVSYPFTGSHEDTDEDGWAYFERDRTMHGGVRADIYIDGNKVADQIWIDEDTGSLSYTI